MKICGTCVKELVDAAVQRGLLIINETIEIVPDHGPYCDGWWKEV